MESYQGVKFRHLQTKNVYAYDQRLTLLNHWAHIFAQLGLAPVHGSGAYGNQSYRTGETSFIITKSAMIPAETLHPDNFCHVTGFDEQTTSFITEGTALPSSESFLHQALYQFLPHINTILHGHCSLLNNYSQALNIPVTKNFYDYGTQDLANSALELLNDKPILFFILKDHGFVALGEDIDSTGKLTLSYFSDLVVLLQMS